MNSPNPIKRVLICDDEEVSRMIIARSVKKLGYEIVGEAATGMEAMNLFTELKPDIVFLDINMPSASGLTVLSFIRDNSSLARIIMVTGDDSNKTSETVIKALEMGANDYLTKGNFDENRLKKAVGHPGIETQYTENDALSLISSMEEHQKEKKKPNKKPQAESPEPQPAENEKSKSFRRMARSTRRS